MIPACHEARGRGDTRRRYDTSKDGRLARAGLYMRASAIDCSCHGVSGHEALLTTSKSAPDAGSTSPKTKAAAPPRGSLARLRQLEHGAPYQRLLGDDTRAVGCSRSQVLAAFLAVKPLDRWFAPDGWLTRPGALTALVRAERQRRAGDRAEPGSGTAG
jgi:hypothetical protein